MHGGNISFTHKINTMTVRELIEQLKDCPQDNEVVGTYSVRKGVRKIDIVIDNTEAEDPDDEGQIIDVTLIHLI